MHSHLGPHKSRNNINFHTEHLLSPLPPLSAQALQPPDLEAEVMTNLSAPVWSRLGILRDGIRTPAAFVSELKKLGAMATPFLPQARGPLVDSLCFNWELFSSPCELLSSPALDTDSYLEPRALWNQI